MKTLLASPRSEQKKSRNRSLRKEHKIPAIVYGKELGSTPIQVEENHFLQLLREGGSHKVIQLTWGGSSSPVMVGEIQKNSITKEIVHIDFKKVDMNEKINMEVPIQWVGEDEATNKGGVLQKQKNAIEIRVLPSNLPESISVDVTGLSVGENITIADLPLIEGVEFQLPPDCVIVAMYASTTETDPLEPQIDESHEPEVIDAKDGPGIDAAK